MNAHQRRTIKRKVKKHGLFWPCTKVSKREASHIKARWKRRYFDMSPYFDIANAVASSANPQIVCDEASVLTEEQKTSMKDRMKRLSSTKASFASATESRSKT